MKMKSVYGGKRMKLRYLGTAAAEGVPAIYCTCDFCKYARKAGGKEIRTRSGALVDGKIKIDFGPDSYLHMLRDGLDFTALQTVIFTHSHRDHLTEDYVGTRRPGFANLPDDHPVLHVYGNAAALAKLGEFVSPRLAYHQLKAFEPFAAEGYTITPLPAVHCVDLNAQDMTFPVVYEGKTYARFEEAMIFLIEKDGKSLLYAHDTSLFAPDTLAYLQGKKIDLVSLDCTNGVVNNDYVGHMSIRQNLEMRSRLLENGAADAHTLFVANHFSHNGLVSYAEMQKQLPGFLVSYDGMIVEF